MACMPCDSPHPFGWKHRGKGDHRVNIIKLQVMFEWSLEWDCRGQMSLPTGMGGKLKTPLSYIFETAIKLLFVIRSQRNFVCMFLKAF